LQVESTSVDGIEFCLEVGQVGVNGNRVVGVVGDGVVPPRAGFGQSRRAAGGRVGSYLE